MKNILAKTPLYIRIIFGSLFIVSGLLKVFSITEFKHIINNLYVFSESITQIITYGLPSLEILLGSAIVVRFKTKMAGQATLFILSVFTGIVIAKISEGGEFYCGCFGSLTGDKIDYFTVLRNLILIAMGGFVVGSSEIHLTNQPSILDFLNGTISALKSHGVLMVLGFILSQNLILSGQNRLLKERVSILIGMENILKPGTQAKSFLATNQEYKRSEVSFNNTRSTLVFVMKANCPACKANIPAWNNLTANTTTNSVRFLGVLLDSGYAAEKYKNENSFQFRIVISPDETFVRNYVISVTPMTILISDDTVRKVWKGMIDSKMQAEIVSSMD